MADSIRERILAAMALQLQSLVTARGYDLDLGAQVHRARKAFAMDELPAVSLIDGEETVQSEQYGVTTMVMDVTVEAHRVGRTNESSHANEVAASIVHNILTADSTWGGLADRTAYQGSQRAFPDEDSTVTSIGVTFQVQYEFKSGDPFKHPRVD